MKWCRRRNTYSPSIQLKANVVHTTVKNGTEHEPLTITTTYNLPFGNCKQPFPHTTFFVFVFVLFFAFPNTSARNIFAIVLYVQLKSELWAHINRNDSSNNNGDYDDRKKTENESERVHIYGNIPSRERINSIDWVSVWARPTEKSRE